AGVGVGEMACAGPTSKLAITIIKKNPVGLNNHQAFGSDKPWEKRPSRRARGGRVQCMAEGVGFEPTEGTGPSTAFKAAAFVHSATPPFLCSLPHCLAHRTNRPMSLSVLDAGQPEPCRFGGAVTEGEGRNL